MTALATREADRRRPEMTEELLRKLRLYEEEYPGQPLVAQRADLRVINQLRAQLGMPLVDDRLSEIGAARGEAPREPGPEEVRDHTAARAIYQAYLEKVAELEVHQAYAEQVARATAGRGQTPVRPLATMGTGGGPLLCDHCGRPILLEGGRFHGVAADVAWRQNPQANWTSWILGGLVVEIQTNGTLRIYHGYPGRGDRQCCNAARRQDEKAQERYTSPLGAGERQSLLAFIEDELPELPEAGRYQLLSKIVNVLYSYDPGIGINRPPAAE
jgi:hypothetical protein